MSKYDTCALRESCKLRIKEFKKAKAALAVAEQELVEAIYGFPVGTILEEKVPLRRKKVRVIVISMSLENDGVLNFGRFQVVNLKSNGKPGVMKSQLFHWDLDNYVQVGKYPYPLDS